MIVTGAFVCNKRENNMSDFYGGENLGGEDPNKKKPGMGKKFLLILLVICFFSFSFSPPELPLFTPPA